jgi:hypothetical protein
LYDHVPTPLGVPNPDGLVSESPAFNFTRLGPRVPAFLVSPWIAPRTVLHRPTGPYPDSQYDHASVAATMKKMFNLPSFLNKRDEWAGKHSGTHVSEEGPKHVHRQMKAERGANEHAQKHTCACLRPHD